MKVGHALFYGVKGEAAAPEDVSWGIWKIFQKDPWMKY